MLQNGRAKINQFGNTISIEIPVFKKTFLAYYTPIFTVILF